ncbi:MAG: T9SS type A sorting domain-containing protein, partial [Chitinophagales bacterium]|nr:T9SS type A sorting domain-containing protein [Chitinophagales bacterium]
SFGSLLKVAVGRIYLDSLSSMGVTADSLYKRYFDKVYKFKNGLVKVPRKACIEDRLGILGGEVPGRNVFQNAYALVGKDSTVVASSNFLSLIKNNKYLFAQVSSTGGYTQNIDVASSSQVKDSMNAVFQGYFGSYFGDWDNNNNFLRSAIAGDGINLTSVWGGRPQWYFHHLALGNTIGFSTLETQNNFVAGRNLYFEGAFATGVHVSLMGDPTLHMHIVTPASALVTSKQDSNRTVKITWASSNDAVLKYYIYRADSLMGKFNLKDSVSSSTLVYLDTMPKVGKSYYMVKACKNELTPYGSYNNLSLGVFASVDSVAAKPKVTPPSSIDQWTSKIRFIFNSDNHQMQILGQELVDYNITIIDMQGKKFNSFVLRNAEWKSLSDLSKGQYIAQITGESYVLNQKIIIE